MAKEKIVRYKRVGQSIVLSPKVRKGHTSKIGDYISLWCYIDNNFNICPEYEIVNDKELKPIELGTRVDTWQRLQDNMVYALEFTQSTLDVTNYTLDLYMFQLKDNLISCVKLNKNKEITKILKDKKDSYLNFMQSKMLSKA